MASSTIATISSCKTLNPSRSSSILLSASLRFSAKPSLFRIMARSSSDKLSPFFFFDNASRYILSFSTLSTSHISQSPLNVNIVMLMKNSLSESVFHDNFSDNAVLMSSSTGSSFITSSIIAFLMRDSFGEPNIPLIYLCIVLLSRVNNLSIFLLISSARLSFSASVFGPTSASIFFATAKKLGISNSGFAPTKKARFSSTKEKR